MSLEPGIAQEVERDDPHVSVHVSDQNQHRPFPENPTNTPRIAALKEFPFVLQYELVQPCIGGDYRGLTKQMGLVNFPIPAQIWKNLRYW